MLVYKSTVSNSAYYVGTPSSLQYTDSQSFFITDLTGDYDAANTGGWGAPNINRADVTTFNLMVINRTTEFTYIAVPPTNPFLNIASSYPSSSQYEITLENMTGSQQTGAFPNGVYQIYGSAIVAPSNYLVTISISLQVRNIVACLRKLCDKIAYGSASCSEIKKYDLLTRCFNELINEAAYQTSYLKSINPITAGNDYANLIFAESVYTRAVNLYNKCVGLCNEGGDCGC